ncbi:MAG TPA: SDR family oxidoreductase [Ktedonosporobacter sp.]|nr:SDR family oxidoreductase [Ktedonosporobacter sp.]
MQGKVALIAGGGRGIGGATARLLGKRGASVVVNYLQNATAAEQTVADIHSYGGQAIAVQGDVRNDEQREALIQQTMQTYGRIDILVNSATAAAIFKPFVQMSWEEFNLIVDGILHTTFELTKAVLPIMQQQHYGRIVYIGSGLSKAPTMPGAIGLATAKAGLVAFAKYIAKEHGPDGITANVVSPGMVETDLSAYLPIEHKQRIAATTPLGRMARPEDIAGVIAFFASDDSGFMTGTYAPVNGGQAME